MPKMKTKRTLAKRVKRTGTGQLKRQQAYVSHFARHKTNKQNRQLRKATLVSKSDYKRIKHLLQD
ncbi:MULTISPECIES: 50S ribosomal protein L35 [Erysipelothrix]|uniref:Large ribosomal subunit protein bL35 n=1 Tax=Erysipelothrix piscisicarius TaxID=2485784 RepID=A0A3S8RNY6_9FIRM|nr:MULTISPECIES: 50S ribosomal protein L35 [Erysipelothrix]AZK44523.1 50S ribosomal protein L35 [Erysipelothrix piscisicarius]MBK2401817.1 50S ribosomal protein L35 [Erysipelothrix sp. strain 2 (EsS2-6-Brazil)]MBK2404043.1 50S ribosomal protein L35 [Erysipelothrix sp. strain 2 (EsS2-7-Brazil)]NBA00905.1 50S ribosomal protein L35 [Erysipelothrix rhusiopathiae]WRB92698.1 50S ribosomal protein L35 [Erysipelothrix rhusiopathiae]